ncbi:Predicted ATP-dependent carboligase, ATP-grasp superfamily [Arboricoccus pini]|uniref:Predicted ATP-dependent carboligase, ATP-grasp superfamily n=2 Tax=Arboricoccus pini TaxID=1963835 RepID=A0A212S005_9PROT|nr:Predicted ATP-dependent carboligase, ATP-grasp superfamily [Arboricoccus pini]
MSGTDLPSSLLREGQMMRDGLLSDLLALGRTVVLPIDPRAPSPHLPDGVGPGTLMPVLLPADREAAMARLTSIVEASPLFLPIGPEGEPELVDLYRRALVQGRLLLGTRPEALEIAADKLATSFLLGEAGLAVPATRIAEAGHALVHDLVLKPRFGAGCLATGLLRAGSIVPDLPDMILEPLVEGVPLSLTLLCAEGEAWLLTANRQLVRMEAERFVFDGLLVGGAEQKRPAMETLAGRIARAMPGLWGLVGVDLIDTFAGPVVIEVNPRPTTAYAALHRALGINPMAELLALAERPLAELRRPLQVKAQMVRVDE